MASRKEAIIISIALSLSSHYVSKSALDGLLIKLGRKTISQLDLAASGLPGILARGLSDQDLTAAILENISASGAKKSLTSSNDSGKINLNNERGASQGGTDHHTSPDRAITKEQDTMATPKNETPKANVFDAPEQSNVPKAGAKTDNKVVIPPLTDDMTPEQKKAREKLIRTTNDAEVRAAKLVLFNFATTTECKALPKEVQAAITRLAKKVSERAPSAGGKGVTQSSVSVLGTLFPEVGTTLTEMDVFKKTKKGRSEFRKYIKLAVKRATESKSDVLHISFDEEAETYKLIAIGGVAPEGCIK